MSFKDATSSFAESSCNVAGCCECCRDTYDTAQSDVVCCKAEDPWKHRSAGMRCATCMWYVEKQGQSDVDDRGAVGRCRRHAPSMGGYPVVFETDWCGDHRLDETKL